MKHLLKQIEILKNSKIKDQIDVRMLEFEQVGRGSLIDIFSELCFCLMTANFSAEGGIRIQNQLCNFFLDLPEEELAQKLKEAGHRFPNARANYIAEAQNRAKALKTALKTYQGNVLRDWVVRNFKGLGYKEASHFLRNIGYRDFAIIDFHIIDLLVREKLIEPVERKQAISKRKYLEIESLLRRIARKAGLNLAELDLYLWFLETGKVLK